jgi:hypothetical protein
MIRVSKEQKSLKRRGTNTNLRDGDRGVSEMEKLVHTGNEDDPNETDDPSTEGR